MLLMAVAVASNRALKERHCVAVWSADSSPFLHQPHRQPQDFKVKPKTTMIYVPNVQSEPVVPSYVISSVDLRPSRHSGANIVTPAFVRGVKR
jgi:hypothetical protein